MSINSIFLRTLPQSNVLKSWKHLRSSQVGCLFNVLPSSGYVTNVTATAVPKDTKAISKVMRAYLERAQEHDEFMKIQQDEFRIGKRHLANMMGEDPETFTQEDVD
ncbi:28S ribosomal protein S9, mitochondrial, partial [Pseudolycoriella hygida]